MKPLPRKSYTRPKVVSLDNYRLNLPPVVGEGDIFLLPYFEELYSSEQDEPRFFDWVDSIKVYSNGHAFVGRLSNYKIWPDRVEADVEFERNGEGSSLFRADDYTSALIQIFERIWMLIGEKDQDESIRQSTRHFIPSQVLLQTATQTGEYPARSKLQIWIVKANAEGGVNWAGAFGKDLFAYVQGRFSSDRKASI